MSNNRPDFYPRDDEGVTTTAPYRRRVGQEIELAHNPETNDTQGFTLYLWENDLGTPPAGGVVPSPWPLEGLHPAHCICDDAHRWPVHTTRETPGGEHVIGGPEGVLFASPAYMDAITAVAEAAAESGIRGDQSTGGHTHVSVADFDMEQALRLGRNLTAIWHRVRPICTGMFDETRNQGYSQPQFQVTLGNPDDGGPRPEFASGCCTNCDQQGYRWSTEHNQAIYRDRNYPASTNDLWDPRIDELGIIDIQSSTTTFRYRVNTTAGAARMGDGRKPTIEFRVWNTMVSKWRLYMAAGISSALVEAAAQGREAPQDGMISLEEHLEGLLTDDVLALMERQRAIVKGDLTWAA